MTEKSRYKKEQQSTFDHNERSFHDFLIQKAGEYGFHEPKKSHWVSYMLDTSRGEKLAESLLLYFNIEARETRHRVLDIGCGYGSLLSALQQHYDHVCGVDTEYQRVWWSDHRNPGSKVICANATKLPFPDEYFDLVISTDVFEHMPYIEQEAACEEIMRVLRPGGHGFVTVPNLLQLFDEHNYAWFATYLPDRFRRMYVETFLSRSQYVRCWEKTGRGWKRLFRSKGFKVNVKPMFKPGRIWKIKVPNFPRHILPSNRYDIYLTK